jgi:SAM-dependent methyltransferase
MSFAELWDRLHREHGVAAVVGTSAAGQGAAYYLDSGASDLRRVETAAGRRADGLRVLDYGCGDGRVAYHTAAVAGSLVCADASGDVLARCRTRLAGLSAQTAQVEWPGGLADDLRFDLVYSLAVAYHLTDLETFRLVRDVLPRLAPGGVFVFDICNVLHADYGALLVKKTEVVDWKQPWPWVAQDAASIVRVALLFGYASAEVPDPDARQPLVVLRAAG